MSGQRRLVPGRRLGGCPSLFTRGWEPSSPSVAGSRRAELPSAIRPRATKTAWT
jgi:hypothetical protein